MQAPSGQVGRGVEQRGAGVSHKPPVRMAQIFAPGTEGAMFTQRAMKQRQREKAHHGASAEQQILANMGVLPPPPGYHYMSTGELMRDPECRKEWNKTLRLGDYPEGADKGQWLPCRTHMNHLQERLKGRPVPLPLRETMTPEQIQGARPRWPFAGHWAIARDGRLPGIGPARKRRALKRLREGGYVREFARHERWPFADLQSIEWYQSSDWWPPISTGP